MMIVQIVSGLIGVTSGVILLNRYSSYVSVERAVEALFLLFTAAFPMLLVECISKMYEKYDDSSGSSSSGSSSGGDGIPTMIWILFVKMLGFSLTWLVTALVYWNFDEYHNSYMLGVYNIDTRPTNEIRDKYSVPFYYNYFRIAGVFINDICKGSIGNVFLAVVGYLIVKQCIFTTSTTTDGYYITGHAFITTLQSFVTYTILCIPYVSKDIVSNVCVSIGELTVQQQQQLKIHCMEQVIKSFYGPLMFCSLCNNLPQLHYRAEILDNFMDIFFYLQNLFFTVG